MIKALSNILGAPSLDEKLCIDALNGKLDKVQEYVNEGANVNQKSGYCKWTPLHQAVFGNNLQIAELLIKVGADVNASDVSGFTPLHWACKDAKANVAELLVPRGADVNAKSKNGETPLYFAVSKTNGNPYIAELLLSKGAEVNIRTKDGTSPLHEAASSGFLQIVELLISKGANINYRKVGKTPLDLAVARNHGPVVLLLTQHQFKEQQQEQTPTPCSTALTHTQPQPQAPAQVQSPPQPQLQPQAPTQVQSQPQPLTEPLHPRSTEAVEDWIVADVSNWLRSLKLSQRYDELLQNNDLNGAALLTMNSVEDWKELGVKSFGDLRILKCTPNPRHQLQSVPNSSSAPVPLINLRSESIEGLEEVTYKPIIKLVDGFTPTASCKVHMLKDLPSVLVGVYTIPEIVDECISVAQSCLEHLPLGLPRLTDDEALALAAYSYDLGLIDPQNNLYYVLNKVLREREPTKMRTLTPFLSFLMSGISKLPPVETTVFRGIPSTSMKIIEEKYRKGVNIHWSAFTSATVNIKKAQAFAKSEGDGGIILRISVMTGRSIQHYSAIQSEEEVLLSPNCKLLVVTAVHKEADGFHYVDLAESRNSNFVF